MAFIAAVILFLSSYAWSACFVGSFLGGVVMIFLLSALASQGVFSIFSVLVFGFIGLFCFDSLFFFLGRHKLLSRLKRYRFCCRSYMMIKNKVGDSDKRAFYFLFASKFVWGVMGISDMYLARKGMSYKKFAFYNSIILLIYLLVFGIIGWVAGQGVSKIIKLYNSFWHGILLLLIMIIALYILQFVLRWLVFDRLLKKKNIKSC